MPRKRKTLIPSAAPEGQTSNVSQPCPASAAGQPSTSGGKASASSGSIRPPAASVEATTSSQPRPSHAARDTSVASVPARPRSEGSGSSWPAVQTVPHQMAPAQHLASGMAALSLEPAREVVTAIVPTTSGTDFEPKQARRPQSLKYEGAPQRPGFGKEGTPVVVVANHFKATLRDPTKTLYHYDVVIKQEKGSGEKRGKASARGPAPAAPAVPKWEELTTKPACRLVMEEFRSIHRSVGALSAAGYDGFKNLYSYGIISVAEEPFIVEIPEKEGKPGQTRPPRRFEILLKLVMQTSLQYLQDFINGRLSDFPMNVIQALDVCLRDRSIKNGRVLMGSSIFSRNEFGKEGALGDHVVAWKGFYQSIRLTQTGVIVNLDTSATAFQAECNAVDLFNSIVGRGRITEDTRKKLRSRFSGLKVTTEHLGYTRRYRIKDVHHESARQVTFDDEEKRKVSVFDYFRKHHQINLKHGDLPCLETSQGAILPMELCTVVAGQKYNKKLSDRQTREMLGVANTAPGVRCNDIQQIMRRVHDEGAKSFREDFGLDIVADLLKVKARQLPPPPLVYRDGRAKNSGRVVPKDGKWNMLEVKLFDGCTIDFWGVMDFTKRNPQAIEDFTFALHQRCKQLGMMMADPLFIDKLDIFKMEHDFPEYEKYFRDKSCPLQLILCIIPGRGKHPRYMDIKRIGDTGIGVVTQCIMEDKTERSDSQYLANVALKINVKCGGRNVLLEAEARGQLCNVGDVPTIIFGADVTHPAPGGCSPSVAALVASQDWPQANKYAALVSAQSAREEIIQHLYEEGVDKKTGQKVDVGMVSILLKSFEQSTGRKPVRILFFRDGVSEGQFQQVIDEEIPALEAACRKIHEGSVIPRITFVVVQKRHHTRFFAGDENRRGYNIQPGTVVDQGVCHPVEFDFYLTSHAGIKGTSRPTKYHVLRDDNKFSADGLQRLVNDLCYTYARCTRSVSVVPPAYYAHLAAFRGRAYLSKENTDRPSNVDPATYVKQQVQDFPQVKEKVGQNMFFC